MSNFTAQEKQLLLNAADNAINFGIENHRSPQIAPEDYPEKLR
jgi:hypothetical protein